MNQIVLIGRMIKDPEEKSTGDGKPFAKFTIAVDRPFDKSKSDFFNCEVWGKSADFVVKYGEKGLRTAVSGALHIDPWTKKDGTKVDTVKVIVDRVEILEKKKEPAVDTSEPPQY